MAEKYTSLPDVWRICDGMKLIFQSAKGEYTLKGCSALERLKLLSSKWME
jgi:hypothetical protein